jgi:hypothetical protein
MTPIVRSVVCTGPLALLFATAAAAEPIRIISGFATAPSLSSSGVISIQGTQGFSLEGGLTHGEGRIDPFTFCFPCLPGTTISVGAFQGGASFPGTATLEGTSYTDISDVDSTESVFLELFGRTVIPAFTGAPVTITAPFTVEGGFNLFLDGVTVPIRGQGIASILLQPQPVPGGAPPEWYVGGVRYDFNNLTPVPEPATILMVAGGLAAIARSARRRRKDASSSDRESARGPAPTRCGV